jgi:hypothetical protein
MQVRRKIRLRKTTSLRCGVRRLVARVARHRKNLHRHRSFFLISEQV